MRFFWMIQDTENIGCFFCLSLHCRPLHLACLVYHTSTAAASILKRSCFSALLKSPVALPGFAGLGAAWPGHIAVRPPFYSALRWRVWIFATRVACAAALLCVCCFSVLPLAHKTERPKSFQFRSAAVVFPIYLAKR